MTPRASVACVALAQVQRPIALFAQGILGRPVGVQAFDGLPGQWSGQLNQAGPDIVSLPETIAAFESCSLNQGLYRVEVLRQTFSQEPAQRALLQAVLASAARPRLLGRLFRIAERSRVDTALPRLYPGATADLHRLRQLELARRRPVPAARGVPWLLASLHRYALGAEAVHSPRFFEPMARLKLPDATMADSLSVAQHLCALLDGRIRMQMPPDPLAVGRLPEGLGDIAGHDGDPANPLDDNTRLPPDGEGQARVGAGQAPAARLGGRNPASQVPDDKLGRNPERPPARPLLLREPKRHLARQPSVPGQGSSSGNGPYRFHPEWDYLAQRYRPAWCRVQEERLKGDDAQLLNRVRERHGAVLRAVRRRFAAIRPETRQRVRGLLEGDELDLDRALLDRVERRAGRLGDGRLFTSHQRFGRDVSAAFLMDLSGSTGYLIPERRNSGESPAAGIEEAEEDMPYFYAPPVRLPLASGPPARRVIDLARDALCLMCDALHGLGDRLAVYGFSGQSRHEVEFLVGKEFHEPWSAAAAMALSGMQPRRYTRTGAAIRHAITRLEREASATRVLIVITDGYPQDTDYGPDPAGFEYGVHDTAQALREAKRAGIAPFCISIDHAANDYLRQMCLPQQYLVLPDVHELPEQLVKVYRALTSG